MSTSTTRILLVDDHHLFRTSLKGLINSFLPNAELLEASDGHKAMTVLHEKTVDLVLLDIEMPICGGIETLKMIRSQGIKTKVLILTQHEEPALISYLFKSKANGFLLKTCAGEEFQKAIATVLTGQIYFDKRHQTIPSSLDFDLSLSPREYQLMTLLTKGKNNRELAGDLGLTIRTVESYRKGLMKKTHCKTTAELISLGYRTGMIAR